MKKTLFLLTFLASLFIQSAMSQTPYLKYDCDAITNGNEIAPTVGTITAIITDNVGTGAAKSDASIFNDPVRGNVLNLPNMLDAGNVGHFGPEIRSLRITSSTSLVGTGDFTFSYMAKIKDFTGLSDNGFPQVFIFDGPVFELRSNSGGVPTYKFTKTGGGNAEFKPSITFESMKSWHQYVLVKSGAKLSLYVDNELKGSASNFNVPNANLTKLRFNGAAHGAGTLLDDIQIFHEDLSTKITSQPANQDLGQGEAANFMVAATGLHLHYQWKKGTENVGTDSPTLSIPAASISDMGTYSVVVTGEAGIVTSSEVTLTLNDIIVNTAINTQPTNQTVTEGQTATFDVEAIGTNLVYQWKKGTENVGTDSPNLSIPLATSENAGTYTVVVTGEGGVVTSNEVTLTVTDINIAYLKYNCNEITNSNEIAPTVGTITAIITDGASVAKDDATIFNDPIRGNVLDLPNMLNGANKGDAGPEIRSLRISSATSLVGTGDFSISYMAKLKDFTGIGDNGFPQLFIFDGSLFEFRTIAYFAANKPSIRFKKVGGGESYLNPDITLASMKAWRQYVLVKTGTEIRLYIDNELIAKNTEYGVPNTELINLRFNGHAHGAGTLLDDIQIFHHSISTIITSQPTDKTVDAGETANLTVAALGLNLHYQWKKGTDNVGTDAPTLSIPTTSMSDGGIYSVVVTGDAGVITSSEVTLTVNDLGTNMPQAFANEATMHYVKGNLFVSNAKNAQLQIFSVTGAKLLSLNVNGSVKVPVKLKKGAYIAKLDAQVLKFIVE